MGAFAIRAMRGLAILSVMSLATGAIAQVPEPETVFFGRIVNRTSGQEYQLRDGTITVTISGGGAPLTVTAPIESLQSGAYSYKLKIPHQAKSLDLAVTNTALPLKAGDAEFEMDSIVVNGEPARPVSGSLGFIASQPKRGSVHRLDLEVFHALDDSDGDGIPDWWEDLYGLDKQWSGDASLKFGDNRYSYLQAFRLGLDPRVDDRLPQLLTNEVTVMHQGVSGLLLRAVASTTAPAQIVYRLTQLPVGGSVMLRNARPDPKLAHRTLKVGDRFTQADVEAGMVEFVHTNPAVLASSLKLQIVSLNRPTEPVEREVGVVVYRPDPASGLAGELWANGSVASSAPAQGNAFDRWRRRATAAFAQEWAGAATQKDEIAAYLLSRWFDYTVWDGRSELPSHNLAVPSADLDARDYATVFVPRFGRARRHVIFAGDGSVRIEGGMNNDILVAGRAQTTIRGNAGSDIFVAGRGNTVIEDFKKSEGDVLDLSDLLAGAPGALASRVEVTFSAGNTQLRISLGDAGAALVSLQGVKLAQGDLETWRRAGTIFTGDLSGLEAPVNRAPVAVDDRGYVSQGQPVSIPVLANDSDLDGDAVTIASVTPGKYGITDIVDDTVVYLPSAGFAGQDEFSYTISDGRGGLGTAKVRISYPYPAASGVYQPLVTSADGIPVGKMSVTLLASGGFSVKLTVRGISYSGKSEFDADGNAQVVLIGKGNTLTVNLHIDLTDPAYPLTGEIDDGASTDQLLASVGAANARTRLPQTQKFTFALHASATATGAHGFATAVLARNFSVRIAGRLTDGSPFSAATALLQNSSVQWTVSFKKGAGWVLGNWNLQESAELPLGGSTQWVRTGTATIDGFDRTLPTVGSLYVAPSVATVSALDFSGSTNTRQATLSLHEGGLAAETLTPLEFLKGDKIKATDGSSVKLALNRASGLWSGTMQLGGVKSVIRGAILQNQNQGFGHFLNGPQAGAAEILPQ